MNTDNKIAVIGKVIQANENFFVLDDGTGKVQISSEKKAEENKLVRAFCTIAEGKMKADIVQQLENFDLNLLKTVDELYSKAGV